MIMYCPSIHLSYQNTVHTETVLSVADNDVKYTCNGVVLMRIHIIHGLLDNVSTMIDGQIKQ